MHMTQEMRQQASKGLLHLVPKKALLRAFEFPSGDPRWVIGIQNGVFRWDENR